MLSGLASGSELKLYAAATIESWKIILIELDDNCEKIGETVFDSKIKCVLWIKSVMLTFLIF
jgi:hypothetical protein